MDSTTTEPRLDAMEHYIAQPGHYRALQPLQPLQSTTQVIGFTTGHYNLLHRKSGFADARDIVPARGQSRRSFSVRRGDAVLFMRNTRERRPTQIEPDHAGMDFSHPSK